MTMKIEILKPFFLRVGIGLLYMPALITLMWGAHTILYIVTFGHFGLYDHSPLVVLTNILSPSSLELFGALSLFLGAVYGLEGALASFRYFQLLKRFCRENDLIWRDLTYFNSQQLDEALDALGVLDDGNYVDLRDGEFFFIDQSGPSRESVSTEIPFRIYHGVRLGKYDTAYVTKKFSDRKWSAWDPEEAVQTG